MIPTTPEIWVPITDKDMFSDNSAELAAIIAIKGCDDRAKFIGAAIEQVRDAYRSGGRILGPNGTIPVNLKDRAIAIALWQFVNSGVDKSPGIQTQSREDNFKEAVAYLENIANRKVPGIGGVSVVSKQHREFTRRKMKGL